MRDSNVLVSGLLIVEKVLKFAKYLEYDKFHGSSGWLEKFKKGHMLVAKVISDENRDVNKKCS